MAEEFPAGVCGGNWWNPARAATAFIGSPSPNCSSVINDIGSFGGCWPSHDHHLVEMKAKSSDESSDGSMVFQDIQKPSSGGGGGTTATMSPDSTFHMMGIGLSNSPPATTIDWNQSLLVRGNGGRTEGDYNHMLPGGLNSFPTANDSNNPAVDNQGFPMNQQQQQPLNFITSSSDCTTSLVTSTYGYPSSLLQTLFDSNSPPPPQQQQQSLYDYRMNLNDFNPVPKLFPPLVKPKQGLHLANKTPYWNAPARALNENRPTFFPSTQSQFLASSYEEKPNCPNITIKSNKEEIRDSSSTMKKNCSEPSFKRPRLETPSPLPTFKVRKEKLGDRITALQQLVSPFGKTDTASVLHEAIEYIKLLHDQVNVLSTPYMKNGAAMQQQQIHNKAKDAEGGKQDLRSRGLCLVPVSSTFPVTTETTPEFWTPSFGGTFR